MVYSLSKLAGFSSSRIGWALVKDAALASVMSRYSLLIDTAFYQQTALLTPSVISRYIFLQSTAPSVESQLRAVKALRAIERSVGTTDDYFSFFRQKIMARWDRLQSLFTAQATPAGYHLDCLPGNIFVWIRCNHATQALTCADMLVAVGIGGDPGTAFGDNHLHARVVIGYYDSTFELQMGRFRKLLQ
jgi:aspartate/methionine/tyrosine aminotransferase